MFKIFIKNLKLFGYHGVNPEEKINGQDFIFNVRIALKEDSETPKIALNDDISNTVNYSKIISIIKEINSSKKYDLLETLSMQIAQNILNFSPLILSVKVKIEKPNPPIKEELESVGVICILEKSGKFKGGLPSEKKSGIQESYGGGSPASPNQKEDSKNIKMTRFYLSIGSNIGDREQNLREAVSGLERKDFITISDISSIYETEPMYVKEQDSFFNIALGGSISADYGPFEFLGLLKSMEYHLGRKESDIRYGPRLIDLDLLYFGEIKIISDFLIIPHPLIKERKFVLLPLAEIAPDLKIEGRKIGDFLKICSLDEKVIKVKSW